MKAYIQKTVRFEVDLAKQIENIMKEDKISFNDLCSKAINLMIADRSTKEDV